MALKGYSLPCMIYIGDISIREMFLKSIFFLSCSVMAMVTKITRMISVRQCSFSLLIVFGKSPNRFVFFVVVFLTSCDNHYHRTLLKKF